VTNQRANRSGKLSGAAPSSKTNYEKKHRQMRELRVEGRTSCRLGKERLRLEHQHSIYRHRSTKKCSVMILKEREKGCVHSKKRNQILHGLANVDP
jgi:hypothetical protein